MKTRNLVLASVVAVTFASAALPAAARTSVDFYVNVAPPAPIVEVAPPPRYGYVWAPGYWGWRHNRHYWVAGHWEHARPGYYYAPARWVADGGRYYYRAPAWYRGDRDHDGVPDRFDHHPDNPYRN